MFTNTSIPTFLFKAMDINHPSCPPSYKLSNDLSKTIGLHSTIHTKKLLIELCVSNYATSNGLVNGINDTFRISTTYNDKTIIWKMFQNFQN